MTLAELAKHTNAIADRTLVIRQKVPALVLSGDERGFALVRQAAEAIEALHAHALQLPDPE